MSRKKFFNRISRSIFLGKWKKTPRCFKISLKKAVSVGKLYGLDPEDEGNMFDKKKR